MCTNYHAMCTIIVICLDCYMISYGSLYYEIIQVWLEKKLSNLIYVDATRERYKIDYLKNILIITFHIKCNYVKNNVQTDIR